MRFTALHCCFTVFSLPSTVFFATFHSGSAAGFDAASEVGVTLPLTACSLELTAYSSQLTAHSFCGEVPTPYGCALRLQGGGQASKMTLGYTSSLHVPGESEGSP